jgi:membrane protein required for colicin V production
MTWVDWAIVIVLAVSIVGGITQGLLRSVCSLAGLFLGLVAAAWNYGRVAALLLPMVHIETIADAIGFLFIAILVMFIANILGSVMSRAVHRMGLGCLDRIAGGAFGFLQGALMVTLIILVVVVFFPQAHWLAEARLPKFFFGVCHLSARVSPAELAERVRNGLQILEQHAPQWMHPGAG